jgi:hypothetical protein
VTDATTLTSAKGRRGSRSGTIALSVVVVAALGLAIVGHLHHAPANAMGGGMVPAAPGPLASDASSPTATATATTAVAPTPTATVYTPPPAPTGVDRGTDPVAASAQAQQTAREAVLAWLHSDSEETSAQRKARLVGLFTPGSSVLTESAPLLEDTAPHSRGDGKIASVQATATEPTATTGEYVVSFEWSMAWWPDTNGKTGALAGDTAAVVKVVYEGGRWLARSIEWAGGHS